MDTAQEAMDRFTQRVIPLMIIDLILNGFTEEQVKQVIRSMTEAFARDTASLAIENSLNNDSDGKEVH